MSKKIAFPLNKNHKFAMYSMPDLSDYYTAKVCKIKKSNKNT
jgi:hypothetical protein